MSVRDILKEKQTSLLTIEEDHNVLEATKLMVASKVGSIMVTFQGKLAGIFTERDLMRIVAEKHESLHKIKLKEVMTTQLTVASPNDEVDDVLNTMLSKRFRHMPVMEDDLIIGLISIGDAVKVKLSKTEKEMHILREYMYGSH
ncbi:CBS domain-containing protein [Leptospira ilyithenensis]|uniref:CBS domain-containing protein n=1 Tax=Leptospira ilyithenensis TaxID=2484901 RepID=A0A4R9LQJ6_9LEPT|nr:CBS domain-containing protein [Leptospira ilyithenensis]TGN11718.1 CBS domain-containing protein [Leptospira ilyithenensis]